MSKRDLSAEKLKEIHDLAAGWGKIIARRVFGESGPDQTVDFQAMEQVAAAAARGLTEGTLATLVEQQRKRWEPNNPAPTAATFVPSATRTEPWPSRAANSLSTSRFATVPTAAGTFSPCGPPCAWTTTPTARPRCT